MRAIATAALILGCSTLSTVAWARNDCGPRGDEPCPEKGGRGSEGAREETSSSESGGDGWMNFELKGPHPYVGIGLNGGPVKPFDAKSGRDPGIIGGSFVFALRGGLYAGRNEIGVELSPMTNLVGSYGGQSVGPAFSLAFNYTGYIPLHESSTLGVYWPMRVAFGFVAGNIPGDWAFMQFRFDLIGLAFKIGHVMLDFSLPSFRYLYAPGDNTRNFMFFAWQPGVHAAYIF